MDLSCSHAIASPWNCRRERFGNACCHTFVMNALSFWVVYLRLVSFLFSITRIACFSSHSTSLRFCPPPPCTSLAFLSPNLSSMENSKLFHETLEAALCCALPCSSHVSSHEMRRLRRGLFVVRSVEHRCTHLPALLPGYVVFPAARTSVVRKCVRTARQTQILHMVLCFDH